MQKRFKSPIAWATTIITIGFFILIKVKFKIDIKELEGLFGIITAIMIACGIWNNPKDKGAF